MMLQTLTLEKRTITRTTTAAAISTTTVIVVITTRMTLVIIAIAIRTMVETVMAVMIKQKMKTINS